MRVSRAYAADERQGSSRTTEHHPFQLQGAFVQARRDGGSMLMPLRDGGAVLCVWTCYRILTILFVSISESYHVIFLICIKPHNILGKYAYPKVCTLLANLASVHQKIRVPIL